MNNFAGAFVGVDDRAELTAFDDDALLLEPAVRDAARICLAHPSTKRFERLASLSSLVASPFV